MKKLIVFLAIIFSHAHLFGQTVEYSLPADLEKTISLDDYKIIVDQAVVAVAKRYKVDHVKDGSITLSARQDMAVFNLDNLVLKCVEEKDHSKWAVIINDHFNSLFASIDAQKKMEPADFEKNKAYLSIRIYPDDVVGSRGGTSNLIARTDLEGTKTILMLDLPQAFTAVSRKDFDQWKKSEDEVFGIALENVSKQKMGGMSKSYDIDGAQIEFNFFENDNYAASYALALKDNSPNLIGEWGSVVAIPNKGVVLVCKISKAKPVEFVKFIQIVKPLIEQSYLRPGPVSKDFFWYYQGKFTRIVVNVDPKGNINVEAPTGLSALIAGAK